MPLGITRGHAVLFLGDGALALAAEAASKGNVGSFANRDPQLPPLPCIPTGASTAMLTCNGAGIAIYNRADGVRTQSHRALLCPDAPSCSLGLSATALLPGASPRGREAIPPAVMRSYFRLG